MNWKDMRLMRLVREAWKEHPDLARFTVVGVLGYVVWYACYSYWLRPGTLLDEYVIHSMVLSSEWVMTTLGWDALPPAQEGLRHSLGMAGTGGVIIGDPCDGVVLFALFALFMVAFPGPVRHKLWFIPVGVLLLHGANIARVVALLYIQWWAPGWLQFNHDYTFTVLIYSFVFGLWFLWARMHVPLQSHGRG
ncbi:MAG: archaeosortase/exosortase family protein [Bacteroidetes bacterium]|nr:archaeosortase/exosortase family protein [Bacteroidota bacterium]MDA0904102.1 archaeosortase/exosortase family protein [Bacteroidota bacterium]MDA1243132.1 archaeosortase/exosortase family protein [Bacteroidota bacterium]